MGLNWNHQAAIIEMERALSAKGWNFWGWRRSTGFHKCQQKMCFCDRWTKYHPPFVNFQSFPRQNETPIFPIKTSELRHPATSVGPSPPPRRSSSDPVWRLGGWYTDLVVKHGVVSVSFRHVCRNGLLLRTCGTQQVRQRKFWDPTKWPEKTAAHLLGDEISVLDQVVNPWTSTTTLDQRLVEVGDVPKVTPVWGRIPVNLLHVCWICYRWYLPKMKIWIYDILMIVEY